MTEKRYREGKQNVQVTLGKKPIHLEPLLLFFRSISQCIIVACDVAPSIILDRPCKSAQAHTHARVDALSTPNHHLGQVPPSQREMGRFEDALQSPIPSHIMLQRAQLGNDVFALLNLLVPVRRRFRGGDLMKGV